MASSAETAAQIKKLLKEHAEERSDAIRLDELRRLFTRLVQSGELDLDPRPNHHHQQRIPTSVQQRWQTFLSSSYRTLVEQLAERIRQGRKTAIRTFWGLIAATPVFSHNRKYPLVSASLLLQWVRAVSHLQSLDDKSLRHMVQIEFLQPFRDVQYYATIAVAQCCDEIYHATSDPAKQDKAHVLFQILTMIPMASNQKDFDGSGGYLFPVDVGVRPEEGADSSESEAEENSDDDEIHSEDSSASEIEDADPPSKKQKKSAQEKRFAFQSVKGHHRVWFKAWIALLRLPLPTPTLKQALQFLPLHVLPNVANPLRFADFFMTAYTNTGVISVLALDSLFILITKHGLEYADFYKQLYRLLTPDLLYVKYRTRFFRLLDKCLTLNEMLPAHVVAAFLKRLVRCTLYAPPSGTLVVLALCSNLIRKHPETACLVHRAAEEPIDDGFDGETDDPEKANALQSSLWELQALERHYYPAVVTLAKSIGREEELATPMHNLEDFLGHTYRTLFEQERKRRRKGTTPLAFTAPVSLFTKDDIFNDVLKTS